MEIKSKEDLPKDWVLYNNCEESVDALLKLGLAITDASREGKEHQKERICGRGKIWNASGRNTIYGFSGEVKLIQEEIVYYKGALWKINK